MVKNGDARRDAIWHDGGAYPPRRPEVSRACPRPMLPTRATAGRVSAAPATRPAHGAGDVGARRGPGWQRLSERGAQRPRTNGPSPPCDPAAAARVDLRRRRPGRPLRHRSGGGGLLRAVAAVGAQLVERRDVAPGHRRHQPRDALGDHRRLRALSRLCHPGRVARHPGPGPRPVDGPHPDAADPAGSGRAAHHDGAGLDRSRPVESPLVAQYHGHRLASADAHPSRCHLRPAGKPSPSGSRPGARSRPAWVGAGTAFKHRDVRRQGTLVVVWDTGQREPWLVLTDLDPEAVGVVWYGLRVWVELGFRVLKSLGWQWERMRRAHTARVERHWLVLAVATLVTVAYGTRVEDAEAHGVAPATLRTPRPLPPRTRDRTTSIFARGWAWLRARLSAGRRLWQRLWLLPSPWPEPSPHLMITVHASPRTALIA